MSVVRTARQLCEDVLGMLGLFTINDEAARPEHMERALNWLDLNMAEMGGVRTRQWLVQGNKTVTLTGGVDEFTLDGVLNVDGMQFPKLAMLHTGSQNFKPVALVDRRTFDSISKPDTSGDPEIAHIDRLPVTPILRIYPVPSTTVTPVRELILTFVEFPVSVGDSVSGNVATELRTAWQRQMIYQMAVDLGSGPLTRLPLAERQDYERKAETARIRLEAFEDREHETTDPIAESSEDYVAVC